MNHEVTQWLAEIKSLQQQLAETQREREEAYASAANWRKLYETEAQQRRTETTLSRQMLESLQVEIQQLRGITQTEVSDTTSLPEVQQVVAQLNTVEALQAKLTEALLECDRLQQALKAERLEHAQTRKSLTTALGDAVDMLSKGEK
ncbi:MAG: hypothetical protein KME16_24825 [Scytolyngbya sp. HA4215-MV1]|jgi:hypothetical protein|nr:hypothetical protein [Scytolyngbya sp. HA4215-MV1]